ncbi:hypothetical protein TNCV_561371 [Trichonephila clavipes]|uniref:Uncharacterized protein n=1 Tax=Trichonephila clavipes TaxID=2585209 RepID=A0A8X6S5I9_TRICX|nr:hypothetical protein TNCV_561371 [Trichonephila clavipes]
MHYAERNSNKVWWDNLTDLPMWPRRKAVAEFCLTTISTTVSSKIFIEFMLHRPLSAHSAIFGRTWMLTTFAAVQH